MRRIFAPLARGAPGAFGLTDDAAVLPLGRGEQLVVTTDGLVEGVHFLPGEPPGEIARRLLRVNLSDLAAMGARPVAYTLNAMLPRDVTLDWLKRFARGLAADQEKFGVTLIGGDTDATPGPLAFIVTALGAAQGGRVLRRKGAAAGDEVYVSGTIGDAMLGLACLQGRQGRLRPADRGYLIRRFRRPEPRVALGQGLVGLASAGIDVSDGLVADLGHLCRTSGVAAVIELDRVPLSPAARRAVTDDQSFHHSLLGGGDDYELAFTAPKGARARVERLAASVGVPVAKIGRIVAGRGVTVLDREGQRTPIRHAGYRHFEPQDAD